MWPSFLLLLFMSRCIRPSTTPKRNYKWTISHSSRPRRQRQLKFLTNAGGKLSMGFTSLRVFVRIVIFGVLLGASSTAYADALSITSFTLNNLQFTAATGTAQF